MPRYLFAWNDQVPPSEQIGEDLPTDESARQFAAAIEREVRQTELVGRPQVTVFKADGRLIRY